MQSRRARAFAVVRWVIALALVALAALVDWVDLFDDVASGLPVTNLEPQSGLLPLGSVRVE